MIKYIIGFLIGLAICTTWVFAKPLWKIVSTEHIYAKIKCFKDEKIALNTFTSFSLNYAKLLKKSTVEGAIIKVPYPDGSLHSFKLTKSGTMSDELAKQFPNIKSYSGVSIENPAVTARFDFNDSGFHGLIKELNDQIIIDPFCKSSILYYISYWKSSYKSSRPADMR